MAFVIGDAAFSTSLRVGSGLNAGLEGALSLARCLANVIHRRGWGLSDFTAHAGFMYSLQEIEVHDKSLSMIRGRLDHSGNHASIMEKILDGLTYYETNKSSESNLSLCKIALKNQLRESIQNHLSGYQRVDPDYETLEKHLDAASHETICVLSKSGLWLSVDHSRMGSLPHFDDDTPEERLDGTGTGLLQLMFGQS